ncbi:Rieske 2Fe-2S domain-containing protein [Dyella sp. BiH032]|uniref:Rieske 2Fe-2S domain-containing protein n=1 Tax=Dyella sp. BiH032 TaxID=3075430 RepID=UPI0028930552|nr:Rieske 2Fe-2S domain-containing protein [Dyella sp. BiH032]WNL44225.1 Rieske 2Fe-2S domain-containing protein [Dyella sp. BiH032]
MNQPTVAAQRKRSGETAPSSFPDGWFAVAFGREVKIGSVQTVPFNGREVVLYRTAKGEAKAVDPHCPHLGAHLGRGGAVDGEHLVCPFHHLRFDTEGRCSRVGGKPPAAVLRHWPVREWNGLIMVWHDRANRPPAWELPSIDMSGYSPPRGHGHVLHGSLQNPAENGVDVNHFSPVHGWSDPVLDPPTVAGHRMTMGADMVLLGQPMRLDITMHGLGCMAAQMLLPRLGLHARVILFPTQLDAQRWSCRELVALRVARLARWPRPLRHAIHTVLVDLAHRFWFVPQFKRDLAIWDARDYDQRPTLMPGEMPIAMFRRWAAQFYGDIAEASRMRHLAQQERGSA